jgi:P22 coat protein - gene protein 5
VANTLTSILPVILAKGSLALRQNSIFSQLVNRDLQSTAQRLGNVVNVPIPSAIAARAVTPAVSFAANVDSSPTSNPVTLDQWFEAPIQLSDSDTAAIDTMNFINMQSSEAIKSLANNVDNAILAKHVGFFGFVGSAGTTPFNASLTTAASAMARLSIQLAPLDNRRAVIEPNAQANLVQNTAILNPFGPPPVPTQVLVDYTIGTKLGMDWYMDQNINANTFTPGTAWVTGYIASTVAGAVGDTTLNIINSTASGTVKVGDIFTVGSGFYVVKTATTMSATVQAPVSFYPALATAVATSATLAVLGTAYVPNMAFHRDAWAFASRPLSGVFQAGNVLQAPTDPISGIALRLELSRQYKQETLSYDVLYGTNVIRKELAVKMLG